MKIKAKDKPKNTDWHEVFVVFPKKTEDGFYVFCGKVFRKWKVHMHDGHYQYRTEL